MIVQFDCNDLAAASDFSLDGEYRISSSSGGGGFGVKKDGSDPSMN